MNNLGHIEPMKMFLLFFKMLKILCTFWKCNKTSRNVDGFEENSVRTCWRSFCQLWQEYLRWTVNVLKSCRKISDPTKRNATQLILCVINGKLAQKCSPKGLSSVLHLLTRWFPKLVLKQELYVIQVTTFFEMNNFGYIQAIEMIFFSKCSQFYVHFENSEKVPEHIDAFEDNSVWTCSGSFCPLWQGHMWWDVNVLNSPPKISDPTKRDDRQLSLA